MTITYWKTQRGHREFEVGGRRYRAFWLSLGHNWSLVEIGMDGLKIAPEHKQSWTPRNWRELESFIAWRAKSESGYDAGDLRIMPRSNHDR